MEKNNFNLNSLPWYYIGQKLICINDSGWMDGIDGTYCDGPTKNEIVTYNGFSDEGLFLKEYPDEWWPSEFVPAQESKLKTISYSKVIEKELVSAN